MRVRLRVDDDVSDPEACHLPARLRDAVGVGVGCQVRLWHDGDPALYTVRPGPPRVGPAGRNRLGAAGNVVPVRPDPRAVHPTADRETAEREGEFVERARDGSGLIALAPHGGHVEPGTDAQARRLADRGAAAWWCAGFWPGGGAFVRWHVTSNDLHPRSFPGLAALARSSRDRGGTRSRTAPFERAVSFHGWTREGVGVGGGAPRSLRAAVRDAVAAVVDAPVALVSDPDYRGDDPANVVNRLARQGVQLEQSLAVRQEHWDDVADAAADVLLEPVA